MLESVIGVSAAGFALGLRFKVPALLTATMLFVLACLLWDWLAPSEGPDALTILASIVAAHSAYLAGLASALAWRRAKAAKRG